MNKRFYEDNTETIVSSNDIFDAILEFDSREVALEFDRVLDTLAVNERASYADTEYTRVF